MNHKKFHPARELPAATSAPTLMTRREMLRNTALGTASTLLMLSPLPEQARSAAALGHPIGGPSNQPLPGTQNDFAQLPLWGDGARWDREQYFSSIVAGRRLFPKTFHKADIDGDGRDELIGRGPGGIEINRFDPSSGQWVVMNVPKSASGKPIWSDQDGWNKPSCYLTIQCADLDKDGRDELIGRGPKGIEIYKYDDSSGFGIWSAFPWPTDFNDRNLRLWSDHSTDHANWNLPQYFQTIQCADLDNDGQAELIGRGPRGIEVRKYDLSGKYWSTALYGPIWSDADKFDGYLYFPSIQCADVDGDKSAELIARGPKGIEIYKFVPAPHDTFVLKPMPVPDAGGTPIWSDTAGWENTSYSLTIQCADIDGDGQAELIGRGPNGIEIYRFDRLTKQWGTLKNFPKDATGNLVWGDNAGWGAPAYYLTIQCADIDGDGRAELIGRGPRGIEIYKYLVVTDDITPTITRGPGGAATIKWPAGTLQSSDTVNGTYTDVPGAVSPYSPTPGDKMFYRTRLVQNPSSKWVSILAFSAKNNAGFAWDDANGWAQYQFYSTVQTGRALKPGDIGYTGDGSHVQSVLLARGSLGMQTWRYDRFLDKAVRASLPVSAVSPLNKLEDAAFLEIGRVLLRTNPTRNIREKYIDASPDNFATWQRQMYTTPPLRYDTPKAERPPTNLQPLAKDIDKDAWEAVVWQVYWETIWAANVRVWFGTNIQTLITNQALAKDLLLQQVADRLKIAPDNTTAIVLNFFILFAAGCAAIVAFGPVPPLAAATGFLGAIIRYVSVSLPGGGNAFQVTFDKLKDHLATSFTVALTENGNFLRRVLAIPTTFPTDGTPTTVPEYGLMKAIGQMIYDTSWDWPGDLTANAVVSMSRSYATSVWQAFWQARGRNLGWYTQSDGLHGVPPAYYQLGPYDLAINPPQLKSWYYLTTSTNWYAYPPLETLQALFDKPDPKCAFPLAVPLEDVFEGLNGWPRLPYSGRNGGEPPPGNPSLPSGFTIQPSLYPQIILSRDPNTNEILAAVTIYNQGLTAVTNLEVGSPGTELEFAL